MKPTLLAVKPLFEVGRSKPVFVTKTGPLTGEEMHGNRNNICCGIDMRGDVIRLCKHGRLKEALDILNVMDQSGIRPDFATYASLLQGCLDAKSLREGKLVHAHMINTVINPDVILQTKLVIMYAKCGSLVDARRVWNEMPGQNAGSWTAMIAAYAKHGHGEEALMLFYQMQRSGVQPNQFTFSGVLAACAKLAALEHGMEIHKHIIRTGFQSYVCVANALVDMYLKCDKLQDAYQVFDKIPERNVVSWNKMIAGYAQSGLIDEALELFGNMPERNVVSWTSMIAAYSRHGHHEEAISLFYQMLRTGIQPDQFTFASVLPACAKLAALKHGKEVHDKIIRSGFQSNVFVGSALVDMYWNCRRIEDARRVFDKMPERNVVSWNAMITGYAQNGHVDEALELFQKMPERNVVSWTAMITGYARNGHVDKALEFFQNMPERNVVSWTAMITGYAQNGHIDEALVPFQKMPEQNVISWNAMITGYSHNGFLNEALQLFQQMQLTGLEPNAVTFASVLPACANLGALEHGKEIHQDILRSGFQSDVSVGNALVDMYAKCGSIEDSRAVFDKMPSRNVVSWTAMIAGYAMQGCGKEALQLFEQMQQSGIKPNHVTFVGVLSACCHAGLVDDAWEYFDRMSRDYYITPTVEHYCCMVDLLGRAGHLDKAQDIINKMPIKPNAAVWGSLLGACRIHTNIQLAESVAECLFESDPQNAAHYVLLSNIYAAAGRWDDVEKVRKLMRGRQVKNRPGCSWIEVNNKVYVFLVGDRSHPQTDSIYAKLERLSGQMKEAGYVPNTNFVLHDVEEEQRDHILYHHSERLAIAFGLINTSPGTPIRIVKNLRVCGDCHSATKFISKIVAREIVVRDANRFHRFKDGRCSCGDYW